MAQHNTHKSTRQGRAETIARRQIRNTKRSGGSRTNRSGRPVQ